ncbi:hypothetical protein HDU99_008824, partial [Rhizoclosmatium hyalinum]
MYAEPDYSSLPIQQFTNWVNWYNYSVYDGIMSEFVELNNRRLVDQTQKLILEALTVHDLSFTPLTSMGVVKVPSSDFFYNYILANPNTTVFGVMFDASDLVLWNIEYTLWYNATTNRALYGGGLFGDSVLQMTRGIDEAIISYLNLGNDKKPSIDVKIHEWPKVYEGPISDSVVQSVGPAFSFCTV